MSGASDNAKKSEISETTPSKKFATISKQKSPLHLSADEHTPRFSASQGGLRAKSPVSDFNVSPGPACYNTGVDSCVRKPDRQHSFRLTKRFQETKPAAKPEAAFYDTRPAVHLLLKKGPSVKITTAKRVIAPHLFHAKNSKAIVLGVSLKE